MNTKYTSTISGEKRTNTVLFLPLPQPQPIDISQKRARHVEVVVEEPVRKSYMDYPARYAPIPRPRGIRESDGDRIFRHFGSAIKFWFLFLGGFSIACFLTAILGNLQMVEALAVTGIPYILRSGGIIICLLAAAVMFYTVTQSNRSH
jgi:hypothetical protein